MQKQISAEENSISQNQGQDLSREQLLILGLEQSFWADAEDSFREIRKKLFWIRKILFHVMIRMVLLGDPENSLCDIGKVLFQIRKELFSIRLFPDREQFLKSQDYSGIASEKRIESEQFPNAPLGPGTGRGKTCPVFQSHVARTCFRAKQDMVPAHVPFRRNTGYVPAAKPGQVTCPASHRGGPSILIVI